MGLIIEKSVHYGPARDFLVKLHPGAMGEICLRCGGKKIQKGVLFGHDGQGGNIVGPKYRTGLIFNMLARTEQAWCDLCLACGEITRIYVAETDREWWTRDYIDENHVF
jgi:hypothetical protein